MSLKFAVSVDMTNRELARFENNHRGHRKARHAFSRDLKRSARRLRRLESKQAVNEQ